MKKLLTPPVILALVFLVLCQACDPFLGKPRDSETLSFSEAVARLPEPSRMGPLGLAAARSLDRQARAIGPVSSDAEDPVLSSELFVSAAMNGGMDSVTASYYGEMRRLLTTLPEGTKETSHDFGFDAALPGQNKVAMSWSTTSSGYRILATLSDATSGKLNFHMAIDLDKDPDAFKFAFCIDLVNAALMYDLKALYYSASYDEVAKEFGVLYRWEMADGTVAASAFSRSRIMDGGMLEIGAMVDSGASHRTNFGLATASGTVFLYDYGSPTSADYFDATGLDFLSSDFTNNTDTYRLACMKSQPAKLCYDDDATVYTESVFIDENNDTAYDSGDTLITEGIIQGTCPLSSKDGIYVPLTASYQKINRPYLRLAHGAALPAYNGTSFALRDGLEALKTSLDAEAASRGGAFLSALEAEDTTPFVERAHTAAAYAYP